MQKLYGLADALEMLGNMSRSEAYREMARGRLRYIQRGRHRLFEDEALDDFVARHRAAAPDQVEQLLELVDDDGRIDVSAIPEGTTLADLEAAKRVVAERPTITA